MGGRGRDKGGRVIMGELLEDEEEEPLGRWRVVGGGGDGCRGGCLGSLGV